MSFVEGSAEHRKGVAGEQTVEHWLRQRGFYMVRLSHIRNFEHMSAPMMLGADANLILPDLLAIDSKGKRPPFYVEVKHKARAWPCYKLGGVLVHGISMRQWSHMRRITFASQTPVWLLVLEDSTGDLLALRIGTADPDDQDHSDKMARGGMVFWRRSRFVLVAKMERRQQQMDLGPSAA